MPQSRLQEISDKIASGKPLTPGEERYYARELFGFDDFEFDRMKAINENKDPNLIID
jgi:hypothetical protein